jgi:hypothetical protein
MLARRMIGVLPMTCPNPDCKEQSTIGNLSDHLKKCPKRLYTCRKCPGPFSGIKADFMAHLASQHELELIGSYDATEGSSERIEEEKMATGTDQQLDRIGKTLNEAGRWARLGETGKFYCGALLEPRCFCCDGHCGTTNGCNCGPCMKLDVQSRRLPKGYLVNKEGRTARISAESGKFYCGS